MEPIVQIGGCPVGATYPAYIVAEIGINHNGDMQLARACIEAAKRAGADAVKFQNYRTEDFVPNRSEMHSYISQGKRVTESQYDMFKRCELNVSQLAELADQCHRIGIGFHSTPTNVEGVTLLERLGVEVLKNGSDYLSHLPLLEAMGKTGLPTVLSTGMSTLEDIEEAVAAFRVAGGKQLILLHCVSQYPAPVEELNLRRIVALRERFACPVGFSDHSEGTCAAIIAVALGACWLEKHFTLDRSLPGPDHAFSSDPQEFGHLVRQVRATEIVLGDGNLEALSPIEMRSRAAYRLSCAAACDLEPGAVLQPADIAFARPGRGFPPKCKPKLIGRTLRGEVKRGQLFEDGMFVERLEDVG